MWACLVHAETSMWTIQANQYGFWLPVACLSTYEEAAAYARVTGSAGSRRVVQGGYDIACKRANSMGLLTNSPNGNDGSDDTHDNSPESRKWLISQGDLAEREQWVEVDRDRAVIPPTVLEAYRQVALARAAGLLPAQPCEICGNGRAVGHHDNYMKPLVIRWLCRSHHGQWHRDNGPGANRQ